MTKRTTLNVMALLLLSAVVLCGPTLLAQAGEAVKSVAGVPPTGPTDSSEGLSAVVWAFMSASFLEWLKRNRTITVISDRSSRLAQRAIGILLAIGASAGVHASFEPTVGVLTVTGLVWSSIGNAGFDALRQWVFQEVLYRTSIKHYSVENASSVSVGGRS